MNNERSNCDKRCPNIDWSRSNTQYSMPLRDLPKTNPASFDKNFLFSRVSHPQRGLKFHHSAGQKNVAKTKTKHFHQTNKNTTPNRLHPTSYGIAPKKHPKSLVENKIDHHKNTSPLHAPGVQTFLAPIPQKLERDFGDGIWLQWVLSMGFSDIRNPYHKPRKNEWSVWLLRVFLVSCPYITIKKLGQKNFILRPCRRYLNQPKRFDAPKLTEFKKTYWNKGLPEKTHDERKNMPHLLVYPLLKINLSYGEEYSLSQLPLKGICLFPGCLTLKMRNLSPHRLVTVESNHFGWWRTGRETRLAVNIPLLKLLSLYFPE